MGELGEFNRGEQNLFFPPRCGPWSPTLLGPASAPSRRVSRSPEMGLGSRGPERGRTLTLTLSCRPPRAPKPLARRSVAAAVPADLAARCALLTACRGGAVLADTGRWPLPAACPALAPGECHCECKRGLGRRPGWQMGGNPGVYFYDLTSSLLSTEGSRVPVAERTPQYLCPGQNGIPEHWVGGRTPHRTPHESQPSAHTLCFTPKA